jgi:hypothetical protein
LLSAKPLTEVGVVFILYNQKIKTSLREEGRSMWRSGQKDLLSAAARRDYPQLDEMQIKLVDDFDWWDGPLSGVAEYGGRLCWFDYAGACDKCDGPFESVCDCPDEGRHYFYLLFPLTDEQIAESKAKMTDGYDETYRGPDLHDVPPLGWFTDGRNQKFYAVQVEKPS